MRKRKRIKPVYCLILSANLLCSCAVLQSPRGWLPNVREVQTQAYGCWIIVDHISDGKERRTSGELIAISPDRLFVLNEYGISELLLSAIMGTNLEIYEESTGVGAWAILGMLSTVSHGYFLVASAPVWIIAGISAGISESKSGLMKFKGPPTQDVRMFARFPQGLPKETDLRELRMKTRRGN